MLLQPSFEQRRKTEIVLYACGSKCDHAECSHSDGTKSQHKCVHNMSIKLYNPFLLGVLKVLSYHNFSPVMAGIQIPHTTMTKGRNRDGEILLPQATEHPATLHRTQDSAQHKVQLPFTTLSPSWLFPNLPTLPARSACRSSPTRTNEERQTEES